MSQPAKLQPCGPGEVGAAVRRALSSQTIVICINHIARGVHGVKVFKCLQGWVLVDYMLSLREVVIIVQCRLLRYLLFTYDDLHCRVFFFFFWEESRHRRAERLRQIRESFTGIGEKQ